MFAENPSQNLRLEYKRVSEELKENALLIDNRI